MIIDTYEKEQFELVKTWESECIAPRQRDYNETSSAAIGCNNCKEYTVDSCIGSDLHKGDVINNLNCNNCGGEIGILEIYQYDERTDTHYIALPAQDVDGENRNVILT